MTQGVSFDDFECVECHRFIVGQAHHTGEPHLCDECLTIPGWYYNEALRKKIDPTMGIPEEWS